MKNAKRNTAIAVTAAVLVGGGGLAVAATSGDDHAKEQKAIIDNAAKRLSVTPDALTSALKGAFEDQLDQAVKDGKITQKQADAMKARIAKGDLPFGGGGRGHGGPGGPGGFDGHRGPGGPGGHGEELTAAAKYLGLTEAQLRAKLVKGTTLAAIAKDQNKDVAGLEAALVDAKKADLAQAVKDGKLTQKQADAIEKGIAAHVKDEVENGRPAHGPGGPGGPGGPDGARHFKGGSAPTPPVSGGNPA